jgi:hypothetical protein
VRWPTCTSVPRPPMARPPSPEAPTAPSPP